jgi:hypothetical protein
MRIPKKPLFCSGTQNLPARGGQYCHTTTSDKTGLYAEATIVTLLYPFVVFTLTQPIIGKSIVLSICLGVGVLVGVNVGVNVLVFVKVKVFVLVLVNVFVGIGVLVPVAVLVDVLVLVKVFVTEGTVVNV